MAHRPLRKEERQRWRTTRCRGTGGVPPSAEGERWRTTRFRGKEGNGGEPPIATASSAQLSEPVAAGLDNRLSFQSLSKLGCITTPLFRTVRSWAARLHFSLPFAAGLHNHSIFRDLVPFQFPVLTPHSPRSWRDRSPGACADSHESGVRICAVRDLEIWFQKITTRSHNYRCCRSSRFSRPSGPARAWGRDDRPNWSPLECLVLFSCISGGNWCK